ncbi:Hypothetical predicted protein [Marmota monax]|uniref:Uncharacterized protein n=1 Tax=Marmota monax TaxID=9995 RepID=A0A5E4BZI6_MARMO|nr:hypothetical protein GHT09_011982 [Marmota monax]VTJ75057.1 Hypothetical predicted protein [Marmota monax]
MAQRVVPLCATRVRCGIAGEAAGGWARGEATPRAAAIPWVSDDWAPVDTECCCFPSPSHFLPCDHTPGLDKAVLQFRKKGVSGHTPGRTRSSSTRAVT